MREVPKSGPLVLKGGGGSADPPDPPPPWLRPVHCVKFHGTEDNFWWKFNLITAWL